MLRKAGQKPAKLKLAIPKKEQCPPWELFESWMVDLQKNELKRAKSKQQQATYNAERNIVQMIGSVH